MQLSYESACGSPASTMLVAVLPGPTRKRTPSLYHYRPTYCNADVCEPGCLMTWEVQGGRSAYQVALERDEAGKHRWHCTCADAVYRAEEEGRWCKHILALVRFGFPAFGRPCGPREDLPQPELARCG